MAQATRTTTYASYDTSRVSYTILNALLLKIESNDRINQADVYKLIDALNAFGAHTHSVTDYNYEEYGDASAYRTSYVTRTSLGVYGYANAAKNHATILYTQPNLLYDTMVKFNLHTHQIYDSY